MTNAVTYISLLCLNLSINTLANAGVVDQTLTKVTIVVEGMMKSKSGAT